jgi:rhamnosyltransferase
MNEFLVAVVVTYNSQIERLRESLLILANQCTVVVVDNSTIISSREEIRSVCERVSVFYLSLGDNMGIAHAQNIGIAWARANSAVDILLMDDDSIPSPSLVVDLFKARRSSRIHLVVVSARTIDENGEDISNCGAKNSGELTPCSKLTSSGTLISSEVFDRVGLFDEHLFIDCVDFEWGWRAMALGVPLFLCNNAYIRHKLGEAKRFGLRLPSPIRHYYQYRNVSMMLLRSVAPFGWRFQQLLKLPIKFFLIFIIADRRFERLRYAAWGLYDFFRGQTGKFNR